ncbi:MAG: hypothetical protein HY520_00560 [Candidatus Aenigmarchaeota archaeon]|nr:hypothetical protein [Candidatus Aenigmarchaeota archaeon]
MLSFISSGIMTYNPGKIEIARIHVDSAHRHRTDYGMISRAVRDRTRDRLRAFGFEVTASIEGEHDIVLRGDPSLVIPRQRLEELVATLGEEGVNSQVVYHHLPGTGSRTEEIEQLQALVHEKDIHVARLHHELEENDRTHQAAVERLQEEAASRNHACEEARATATGAHQRVASLEGNLEKILAEIEPLKSLEKRVNDGILVDRASVAGGMDVLLLEGFSRIEIPIVKAMTNELENDIADAMKHYGIGTREELFGRVAEAAFDLDEQPGYEPLQLSYKGACKLLDLVAKDPTLEKLVDLTPSKTVVERMAALKQRHEEGKEIGTLLHKTRKVNYLMERREHGGRSVLRVYVPLAYREQMDGLDYTQAEILSVVHDSWTSLRDEVKGEGTFSRAEDRGITVYEFAVPSLKVPAAKTRVVEEEFVQQMLERAGRSPLSVLGVRFVLNRLLHAASDYSPGHIAPAYKPTGELPRQEHPEHPREGGEGRRQRRKQYGDDPRQKDASPLPEGDVRLRRHRNIDEEDPVYAELSVNLRERGIRSSGIPSEYVTGNVSDPQRACRLYAVIMLAAKKAMDEGRLGATRGQMIAAAQERFPEYGTFPTRKRNYMDSLIGSLANNGFLATKKGASGRTFYAVREALLEGGNHG